MTLNPEAKQVLDEYIQGERGRLDLLVREELKREREFIEHAQARANKRFWLLVLPIGTALIVLLLNSVWSYTKQQVDSLVNDRVGKAVATAVDTAGYPRLKERSERLDQLLDAAIQDVAKVQAGYDALRERASSLSRMLDTIDKHASLLSDVDVLRASTILKTLEEHPNATALLTELKDARGELQAIQEALAGLRPLPQIRVRSLLITDDRHNVRAQLAANEDSVFLHLADGNGTDRMQLVVQDAGDSAIVVRDKETARFTVKTFGANSDVILGLGPHDDRGPLACIYNDGVNAFSGFTDPRGREVLGLSRTTDAAAMAAKFAPWLDATEIPFKSGSFLLSISHGVPRFGLGFTESTSSLTMWDDAAHEVMSVIGTPTGSTLTLNSPNGPGSRLIAKEPGGCLQLLEKDELRAYIGPFEGQEYRVSINGPDGKPRYLRP